MDDKSVSDSQPVLRATGIVKTFGATTVLHGVDFDVRRGEVHALVGENGAGKSTLLKILSGRYEPTAGQIEIDGRAYASLNAALAKSLGINVVPQHLEVINHLSIADNLFLNHWPTRGLVIDRARMLADSEKLLSSAGVPLDPRTIVRDLTYVEKQMVEIARISSFDPRLIILDEPTAALSVREIEVLFGMIRQLRAAGIGVVYVSHYLSEIGQISDRVTIMRDGQVVATGPTRDFTTQQIIHHMVGDIEDLYTAHGAEPGPVVLDVQHAQTDVVRDLSFQLRAGEILGLAAPKGEGISQFLRALCRVSQRLKGGAVTLKGEPLDINTCEDAFRCGIGYLSEERARWGLIRGRAVSENISISSLGSLARRFGVLNLTREREMVADLVDKFWVRTPSLNCDIRILSGGNQQKALLARLLGIHLAVYVLDDPTFGVDVRSKSEINKLISCEVAGGAAVLLHTSDMDQLLNMSDRIVLVKEGRVASEHPRGALGLTELERLVAA
jgi:ribose transport system ATP-binding protein